MIAGQTWFYMLSLLLITIINCKCSPNKKMNYKLPMTNFSCQSNIQNKHLRNNIEVPSGVSGVVPGRRRPGRNFQFHPANHFAGDRYVDDNQRLNLLHIRLCRHAFRHGPVQLHGTCHLLQALHRALREAQMQKERWI